MQVEINQIVKGVFAGTFVVLGFRTIYGEQHAQVKPVNPNNYAEHGKGELCLPLSCLKAAALAPVSMRLFAYA